MSTLVTIVTIVYNCEDSIGKTIESVLDQTHKRIEYIIIDGASKDGTVAVAESYRKRLEERGIIYRVYSEPDEGIYDAMNKGISKATGEIIGILNSGDWYESSAVKTAVEELSNNKADLCFANIRMHMLDGKTFVKKARIRTYQTSRDWNHPTMFVKSDIYKANPFRCRGIHDDYGTYLQMRKEGAKIITLDEVLANFYMGGVSNNKNLKAALRRIKDRYQWCYRVNGYSRFYIVECILVETAKMILG